MPVLLDSLGSEDALRFARVAAEDFRRSPLTSLAMLGDQGCFSVTFLAVFEDKTEVIIQLRDNKIDTALVGFARGLLGDIVPAVQAVKSCGIPHAYAMPFIRGNRWSPLIETSVEEDVAIAREFGSILAKCMISMNSDAIVENYIIPRLEKILENDLPDPLLRIRILNLLDRAHHLKRLPLMVCHIDPNPFNVRKICLASFDLTSSYVHAGYIR